MIEDQKSTQQPGRNRQGSTNPGPGGRAVPASAPAASGERSSSRRLARRMARRHVGNWQRGRELVRQLAEVEIPHARTMTATASSAAWGAARPAMMAELAVPSLPQSTPENDLEQAEPTVEAYEDNLADTRAELLAADEAENVVEEATASTHHDAVQADAPSADDAPWPSTLEAASPELAEPVELEVEGGPFDAEIALETIRANVGELASQIERLDDQFDGLRAEVRQLDQSLEAISAGAAAEETTAADLSRMGHLVEIVAGELKRTQTLVETGLHERTSTQREISGSLAILDHRLAAFEDQLQHLTERAEAAGTEEPRVEEFGQRLDQLEAHIQQIQDAVEQMKVQNLAERADRMILAARSAEAAGASAEAPSRSFLASLTHLFGRLKKSRAQEAPEPAHHD